MGIWNERLWFDKLEEKKISLTPVLLAVVWELYGRLWQALVRKQHQGVYSKNSRDI